MQQVTAAITDEELGGAPFTVIRSFYRPSGGGKVLTHEERYETYGTIHPAKLEDLQLLPEEYRHETVIHIHSPVALSMGAHMDSGEFSAPDRILCHRREYRVISVRDWSAFGFCRALAVLQKDS